ncbi:hypothetical protein ACVXHB_24395 [Escherichia coli]
MGMTDAFLTSLPGHRRPSPLLWRVSTLDAHFDGCSVFTHVTARITR